MFDITLRRLKDRLLDPLAVLVPSFISPDLITTLAFLCGLLSCNYARLNQAQYALAFWALNRILDCLDGAVARRRGNSSARGGFLDLLSDFIIYSLIPIALALSQPRSENEWLSVSGLEMSFHVNNFILFYSAAVAAQRQDDELTSVTMRPALIEGFESGVIFTIMLAQPEWLEVLSWGMALAVGFGIVQRSVAICRVLQHNENEGREPKSKDNASMGEDKKKR